MKQAEQNVASKFRSGSYNARKHNCHDYRRAVNEEYTRLVRQNGGIPMK
jgi:hypothetical protein